MHTHIFRHIQTHTVTRIHNKAHTHTHIRIHTTHKHTYAYRGTQARTIHRRALTGTYRNTHTHMRIHTHTCTGMHMYTPTCIYILTQRQTHMPRNTYMQTDRHAYARDIHASMHTCKGRHTRVAPTCSHTKTLTGKHTHIPTYIHACTTRRTHTHTYAYIQHINIHTHTGALRREQYTGGH